MVVLRTLHVAPPPRPGRARRRPATKLVARRRPLLGLVVCIAALACLARRRPRAVERVAGRETPAPRTRRDEGPGPEPDRGLVRRTPSASSSSRRCCRVGLRRPLGPPPDARPACGDPPPSRCSCCCSSLRRAVGSAAAWRHPSGARFSMAASGRRSSRGASWSPVGSPPGSPTGSGALRPPGSEPARCPASCLPRDRRRGPDRFGERSGRTRDPASSCRRRWRGRRRLRRSSCRRPARGGWLRSSPPPLPGPVAQVLIRVRDHDGQRARGRAAGGPRPRRRLAHRRRRPVVGGSSRCRGPCSRGARRVLAGSDTGVSSRSRPQHYDAVRPWAIVCSPSGSSAVLNATASRLRRTVATSLGRARSGRAPRTMAPLVRERAVPTSPTASGAPAAPEGGCCSRAIPGSCSSRRPCSCCRRRRPVGRGAHSGSRCGALAQLFRVRRRDHPRCLQTSWRAGGATSTAHRTDVSWVLTPTDPEGPAVQPRDRRLRIRARGRDVRHSDYWSDPGTPRRDEPGRARPGSAVRPGSAAPRPPSEHGSGGPPDAVRSQYGAVRSTHPWRRQLANAYSPAPGRPRRDVDAARPQR